VTSALGGKRHLGINLPSPPLRCEKCDEQCGSDSASRCQHSLIVIPPSRCTVLQTDRYLHVDHLEVARTRIAIGDRRMLGVTKHFVRPEPGEREHQPRKNQRDARSVTNRLHSDRVAGERMSAMGGKRTSANLKSRMIFDQAAGTLLLEHETLEIVCRHPD